MDSLLQLLSSTINTASLVALHKLFCGCPTQVTMMWQMGSVVGVGTTIVFIVFGFWQPQEVMRRQSLKESSGFNSLRINLH